MKRDAFVSLLMSVRDHLTVAIHDAQRGDAVSAVEQIEAARNDLKKASEELRAA